MKAKSMVEAYTETFKELSIEFNSYILAGSIVLPEPRIVDGGIYINLNGPLYNASFLFGPDGKVVGEPILKSFLNSSEESFATAADPTNYPVFNLPFGKTSVLLYNDSWHNETYRNTKEYGAEIILVPSSFIGDYTMHSTWIGYDGIADSLSFDMKDIGKLTNLEAFEKYGLPSQIKETKAIVGMNVFLRGDLWEMSFFGQPIAVLNNTILPVTPGGKGGVWSLNF